MNYTWSGNSWHGFHSSLELWSKNLLPCILTQLNALYWLPYLFAPYSTVHSPYLFFRSKSESRLWLLGVPPVLARTREEAAQAVRSISRELVWKIHFEKAQARHDFLCCSQIRIICRNDHHAILCNNLNTNLGWGTCRRLRCSWPVQFIKGACLWFVCCQEKSTWPCQDISRDEPASLPP